MVGGLLPARGGTQEPGGGGRCVVVVPSSMGRVRACGCQLGNNQAPGRGGRGGQEQVPHSEILIGWFTGFSRNRCHKAEDLWALKS